MCERQWTILKNIYNIHKNGTCADKMSQNCKQAAVQKINKYNFCCNWDLRKKWFLKTPSSDPNVKKKKKNFLYINAFFYGYSSETFLLNESLFFAGCHSAGISLHVMFKVINKIEDFPFKFPRWHHSRPVRKEFSIQHSHKQN